jgi:hypothetical protein
VGVKHGAVVAVKAFPEKLIAFSLGHEFGVNEGVADRLEVLKVFCHIVFIFHEVFC